MDGCFGKENGDLESVTQQRMAGRKRGRGRREINCSQEGGLDLQSWRRVITL